MRVAVLSYPDITPANVASLRKATERRGVSLEEWLPHDVSVWCDGLGVTPLYRGAEAAPDVLLHRTVARLAGVVVPALRLWAAAGVVVPNDPDRAAVSRDKVATVLALAAAGVPYVATLGFFPSDRLPVSLLPGPVVVKPAHGLQGRDVAFFADAAEAQAALDEVRWGEDEAYISEHYVAQPAVGRPGEDLRAFVVGGRCLGLVRRRATVAGERRANLHLGGQAAPLDLDHPAAALAVATTEALGLDYAGVDMLEDEDGQPLVLEADAWAGFAGVEEATGADIAGAILDLALARI